MYRLLLHLSLLTAASLFLPGRVLADGPVDAKALTSDPRVRSGVFSNGLTWMYRQHNNPPGKMALLLFVDTGSLNETDNQRGLAHFIEHMCFNGTEHFPPGKLIPYFESIGMQFGADLNASTGFESTRYTLFLPDATPPQVDKALLVLSDFAFRAQMLDTEIEKERGIILSEKRARDNVASRLQEAEWKALHAESLFAQRLPIGVEEVLNTARRDVFTAYYQRWYRPDKMTLVCVGDAAADDIVPLIEKNFSSQPRATGERPASAKAGIRPSAKERALVLTDPEYRYCVLELQNVLPGRPPTRTPSAFRMELVERLARSMMNRRYSDRMQRGEARYQSATAGLSQFMDDAMVATATANCEPRDWETVLQELIEELNRVREHGFTAREFELASADLLADAERDIKTEPSANARGLLFQIAGAVDAEEPYLCAQQRLELVQVLLPTISATDVRDRFNEGFGGGAWTAVLKIDPSIAKAPTEDDLLAAMRAAKARQTAPLKESSEAAPLVADELKPAALLEPTENAALGISHVWLSNGVRVHHRFMDYKKDQVFVSINLAGGQIEETADNLGITEVAGLALSQPATKRIPSTEIRDRLTGKNIRVTGSTSTDKASLRILGSPTNVELAFQVAHALLTEGLIEQSAFDTWQAQRLQQLELLRSFPEFQAAQALGRLLSGNDPRLRIDDSERISRQTREAAQVWLERLTQHSPIEVAILGEISRDEAFRLAAQYIGSLPERPRKAQNVDPLRRVQRSDGPLHENVVVKTATKKSSASFGFVGAAMHDDEDHLALRVGSAILTMRLIKDLREDKAWVYSIGANSAWRRDFEDMSAFSAGSTCSPDKADAVIAEIRKQFEAFAADGPTDEELVNAKKQILNNLDTQMKEPQFWWTVLEDLDYHGVNLERYERSKELVEAVTREQVHKTFSKYFTPQRSFSITAGPAPEPASQSASPAAAAGANP